MSLQIWLPLIGNTNNLGLSNITSSSASGITYSDGKIGKCLSASSNVTVTITLSNLAAMLANGTTYSLSCWVKITNNVTSGWVIKLGTNTCGLWWANSEARWVWNENDNGKRCANPTISADTNWHHLVTTVDKTVTNQITAKHYVDGLPASGYETHTWDCSSQSQPAGTTITLYPYVAMLNDIRLYDHVLSPKEIKEISKGLVCHYPLDNNGSGMPNEIANSMPYTSTSGYSIAGTGWGAATLVNCDISPSGKAVRSTYSGDGGNSGGIHKQPYSYSSLENGEIYTFSLWIRASKSVPMNIYNEMMTSKTPAPPITIGTEWTFISVSGPVNTSATYHSDIAYCTGTNVTTGMWIEIFGLKLEKGNKATPWMPHTSDAEYSIFNINSNKEIDTSGYTNHGTKNGTITYNSDTPRYSISTIFNGSNTFIACGRGGMVKDEITLNVWAYMNDWSTVSDMRIVSCTEGGGWCIGYVTDALKFYCGTGTTSNTYKTVTAIKNIKTLSAGWHMFSGTYNGLQTKIYIDGILDNTLDGYTTKTPLFYHGGNGIFIGAEAGGNQTTPISESKFSGYISDFRIYATALSADDIKQLYQTSASIDNAGNIFCSDIQEV